MDDEYRGGSLPGALLVLVGPTPVVGHGVALEELRVLSREARVVDQDHHGLPRDVHRSVVVPTEFGCHRAIADENQLGRIEADVLDDPGGSGYELRAVLEGLPTHRNR